MKLTEYRSAEQHVAMSCRDLGKTSKKGPAFTNHPFTGSAARHRVLDTVSGDWRHNG
jgi:hypothetical protein